MRWRKTRRLLSIILLAFLVSIIGNTVYAEEDTITVGVPVTYDQTEARSMLSLVNDFRTGDEAWEWNSDDTTKTVHNDLKELAYDYDLEKIAMKRVVEIAIYFSHTRPNGNKCWTIYDESGLSYSSVAENIAAGTKYTTAEAVFEGWKETDKTYSGQGHRRNMLSSSVTAIGIGHVVYNGVHYWVQEFRSPTGSTKATTANDTSDTVQIEVLKSNITDSSIQSDAESLTIPYGESVNTPTITSKIRLNETWPSNLVPVILSYDWTAEDNQIVEISNGKITGLKAGTTNLTTAFSLNQTHTVTIPLTVERISINDAQIDLSTNTYTYDGSEKQPAVNTVTLNGKTLINDQDYSVSYRDNINVGTASVIITGMGNYTGTVEKTFSITPKDIEDVTVNEISDQTYTGSPITPSITVKDGAATLQSGTDYTVSYSNNTNAGTASVTITGKGNYSGTNTKNFTILPKSIKEASITGISDKTYSGKAITQNPVVKDGTTILSENTDYTISYENNTNAGTAKVIITGTGNYTGSIEGTFSIAPKPIYEVTISGIEDKVYTGQEITQELIVKDGEELLSENEDYTVDYLNNLEIGTATIKISGKGNYTDSIEKNFSIGKDLKDCTISGLDTYTYTGKAIEPDITVSDGTILLTEDTDYTVTYDNNINAGTASVMITGRCNYIGTVTESFVITKKNQTIAANSYSKTYGSKPFALNAKAAGKLSYRSSNNSIATVSGTGNVTLKSPGKVTITISAAATENYHEATKQITITISPKKVAGLSVKAGKKKLTVSWKKDSKVTGYQITYAQNSKFTKGVKSITISKNSTIKKDIKSLKSKKTYYVKIRSYKMVGKTPIYSTYSTVKKVKVK